MYCTYVFLLEYWEVILREKTVGIAIFFRGGVFVFVSIACARVVITV